MKRFEFSLDRLLKIKSQLERLAELEQLRAREDLDRKRGVLDSLREQLTRVADHLSSSIGRPMAPLQWASASDMTDRLGHSIRIAEDDVSAAERKLVDASQERAQLATEVEALSTLRKQQWDQWRQEASKADQLMLDQVGMNRWRAAHGGGAS